MAAEETKKPNIFVRAGKRIARWFREMRSELKKVVWPTKSQIINNTLIVLASVLVVGVCVWVFDAVANLVVQGIIKLCTGA